MPTRKPAIRRYISTGLEYIGKCPLFRVSPSWTPSLSNRGRYDSPRSFSPNMNIFGKGSARNMLRISPSSDRRTMDASTKSSLVKFRKADIRCRGDCFSEPRARRDLERLRTSVHTYYKCVPFAKIRPLFKYAWIIRTIGCNPAGCRNSGDPTCLHGS